MTMKQLISRLVEVKIGDTVVDLETPMALPPIEVEVCSAIAMVRSGLKIIHFFTSKSGKDHERSNRF
jgi:hypothetical protein